MAGPCQEGFVGLDPEFFRHPLDGVIDVLLDAVDVLAEALILHPSTVARALAGMPTEYTVHHCGVELRLTVIDARGDKIYVGDVWDEYEYDGVTCRGPFHNHAGFGTPRLVDRNLAALVKVAEKLINLVGAKKVVRIIERIHGREPA